MPRRPARAFCMSVTPFHEDGSVDESALRVHLERLVQAGNAIMLTSPGAGESQVMSVAEHRRVYDIGVEVVSGRVPLWAAVREWRDAKGVYEVAKQAQDAGMDAAQIYGLDPSRIQVPTQAETESYFRELLDELDIPVSISTSPVVPTPPSPALLERLCRDYPQIVHVNAMAASGDVFAAIRDAIPDRVELGGQFNAHSHWLGLGATTITMAENNIIPETCQRMMEAFAAGDLIAGGRLSAAIHRFSVINREWFPATARPTKMSLKVLGLGNGVMRPPYLLPPQEDFDRLSVSLRGLGIAEIDRLVAA